MQLLGRQWLIMTSEGQQHAVVPRGSTGVVGCTPILKPGECFQYYSATDLSTSSGKQPPAQFHEYFSSLTVLNFDFHKAIHSGVIALHGFEPHKRHLTA